LKNLLLLLSSSSPLLIFVGLEARIALPAYRLSYEKDKGQIVVRFPPVTLELVILESVKTGCGPHTFAHSAVTVVSFHRGKSTEACS
jgi:hypothetical protein